MRHRMGTTLLSAARHEAAHVVICQRFGGQVRWARVFRLTTNGERGETCFGNLRKLGPVQFACVAVAGSVAEHLWHGTPKGVVGAGDFEQLRLMGIQGEDVRIVWEETSRLLRKLKPDVWRLARRLLKEPGARVKP